jgi:hypothetical protein
MGAQQRKSRQITLKNTGIWAAAMGRVYVLSAISADISLFSQFSNRE